MRFNQISGRNLLIEFCSSPSLSLSLQLNVAGISKALVVYKVYQTMFRIVKESETVDSRQHCFLLQSSGHEPRYLSVETRQELLRIENSWNAAIVTSVIKLGVSTKYIYHIDYTTHDLHGVYSSLCAPRCVYVVYSFACLAVISCLVVVVVCSDYRDWQLVC